MHFFSPTTNEVSFTDVSADVLKELVQASPTQYLFDMSKEKSAGDFYQICVDICKIFEKESQSKIYITTKKIVDYLREVSLVKKEEDIEKAYKNIKESLKMVIENKQNNKLQVKQLNQFQKLEKLLSDLEKQHPLSNNSNVAIVNQFLSRKY